MFLARPVDELFAFFSKAENLQELTPGWMKFRILTPLPIEMKVGTLIDYRIGVHGVPMRWRTLISDWQPGVRFVDDQLKGPYLKWHHTHTFEAGEKDGVAGTWLGDSVRYRVLMGWLVHGVLVKRDLQKIFDYRLEAIHARFGDSPA